MPCLIKVTARMSKGYEQKLLTIRSSEYQKIKQNKKTALLSPRKQQKLSCPNISSLRKYFILAPLHKKHTILLAY